MSALPPHPPALDEDEIQVTSPTSYALRESIRRSSSSSSADFAASAPGRADARTPGARSRNSFFSRAPPPPPPPPHGGYAPAGLARTSSNPSLSSLDAHGGFANTTNNYYSTTALSAGGNYANFSQTAPSGTSSRRSSSRRSLFSRETFAMLNRDKDAPVPTIPESDGALEPIKCEGYLTKRGHLFTNWKTRYFTLRGNVLEYFSGDDKSKKYGAVTVAKVAPWSGESHGFMFYTTKQIPYYVYASSAAERAKWLRALQEFVVETDDDIASCEGYLTKRGHLVPSQRAAYYVLTGTVLRHFFDQQAYRENQSAMAEFEVRSVSQWDGEPHGLMFQTVTGNVFYASADTPGEQQKWLATVKKSTANLPEPVACAGYLTKQGHKRKSWKKRYFILRGSSIAYYSDFEMANSAKGKPLAEVTVEDVQRWDGEPFGFMFMTSEQVPYYVYADNDRERNKWMNALRKLNTVDEEPETEKKRCPNCNAVLTGSRFCGACGFNLRGTTVKERARYSSTTAGGLGHATGAGVDGNTDDMGDQMEFDDENTPFDELEALSEGARTLLLAVMQTPDGIEVPEKPEPVQPMQAQVADISAFEDEVVHNEVKIESPQQAQYEEIEQRFSQPKRVSIPKAESPVVAPAPSPAVYEDDVVEEKEEVEEKYQKYEKHETYETYEEPAAAPVAPPTPPRSSRQKSADAKATKKVALKPNFDIVAPEPKPYSFTSFSDSEEESKVEPKPKKPAPTPVPMATGLRMGNMGVRKTTAMLAMESSSDEEGSDTELPSQPPVAAVEKTVASEEKEEEEEEDYEEPVAVPKKKKTERTEKSVVIEKATAVVEKEDEKPQRRRTSSSDSLELDTRGISAFDEPAKPAPTKSLVRQPSAPPSASTARRDLYTFMEHELNFTPQFVPSAESPVRCRIYTSMAYATAKKVLLFLSDSGPMGVWKQDADTAANATAPLTIDHKWSMLPFLSRAQDEGYGIITCNPFSNSAVVYEAGGFERTVPIPNSSTPQEHVHFVWENFASKCRGQVSIIAFARGGALVKSLLETFEDSVRDKIHRIALIESRHEIDHNESPGVLELLGRRSINWEASYEPLGAQIVDSQARVNCVCLSLGFMPSQEADNTPKTLEKGEDPAFAFVGANPEQPGMTAVVKFVRAELRRRKNQQSRAPQSLAQSRNGDNTPPSGRPRRQSNIVVIGETDAEESSDMSTGEDGDKTNGTTGTTATTASTATTATTATGGSDDNKIKATYYLPKPVPKQQRPSNSPTRLISDKDFELLKVVGQGGFGKVFLCRKVTPPHQGESYAMKVLKKQQVVSSGLVNTTMAERKILTEISHPFVVKLHYAFQSESKLYLVMDYLSGGSLATHLRRRRKFPEEWARFYAAEVAAAIAHLHSANIIYRDAKLENVLMDHEGHVRITDFGLSKVGVSGLKGATTFCGTAAYIAPELLRGKTYGKAADWWSFGILLYEMIGGKPPYYHRNRDIMFQTILKQDWVTFSPNFSDAAISLINGLLTRDPTMRLGSGPRGADEVLTHPFFDAIDWPALLERKVVPPFNPGVGKLDTHYAPRNMNEITARDREASVMMNKNARGRNDFDGFSFVGRPSSLS